MGMAPSAPLVSSMLMMLVIVSTGTAWFIALHPGFIWRMMQGNGFMDDPPAADCRMIRKGGMLFGAAGIFLLFLADIYP